MPRNCFSCTIDLTYSPYCSKNGRFYCKSCYEIQFSRTCTGCNQKIQVGQKGLTWKNTAWHDSCFNCTQCNRSLLHWSSSVERNNLPYCSNCYNLKFSPICNKCDEVIEIGTSWIDVKGSKLHIFCCNCSQCNASLVGQPYYDHNGNSYCTDCDNQHFCPRCASCGQVIRRGTTYLNFGGQTIHNKCFTCSGCGQMIEGFYQTKNGNNYHPHCVDNSYFPQRRFSVFEPYNYDRTRRDQTDYNRYPAESIQKIVTDNLTTITPLNLRSSTAKSTRRQRSTADLPDLLNTTAQSTDHPSPQFSQETASSTIQDNSTIKKLREFTSQVPERAHTAAARRTSVEIIRKSDKATATDFSQLIRPPENSEQESRGQSSLRRASIPPNVVQKTTTSQMDQSNPIPPKPIPRKTRTCQVCYEDKPVSTYNQSISHQCGHRERTICNTCIYRHVTQAFEKMCRDDVRCPELDCEVILDYDAIKKILLDANDTTLLERYERFYLEHQLERMPEFIWCAHGCGSGQLAAHGDQNNIVTCIKCDKKSCFNHRTRWHEGFTCANYDQQTDSDRRATEQWLAQKTKNCPNCQSAIEKTSGCDHMTCAQCHFEFCWACLANYALIRQDGNHRHHHRCKHFRSQNGQTTY